MANGEIHILQCSGLLGGSPLELFCIIGVNHPTILGFPRHIPRELGAGSIFSALNTGVRVGPFGQLSAINNSRILAPKEVEILVNWLIALAVHRVIIQLGLSRLSSTPEKKVLGVDLLLPIFGHVSCIWILGNLPKLMPVNSRQEPM
jgi:hypothetical protein